MLNLKNCILCGGASFELINRRGMLEKGRKPLKFDNVICRDCGMIFMNPRAEESDYQRIYARYENSRYGCENREEASRLMDTKFSKLILTEPIYDFLKEYLYGGKRVLDIGCGFGHLSNAFKNKYGCEVAAVEPSDILSELVREKYGVEVFNGGLDDFLKSNNRKFNLLILSHVFEHFADPVEKLNQMKELLLPGGVIYMEVPNARFFKRPVNYFFDFCHPFSYSPKTFRELIKKCGYKIIKADKNRRYHLGAVIASANSDYADIDGDAYLQLGGYADIKWYVQKKKIIDAIRGLIYKIC